MVEFFVRIQIVILWTAIPILFAVVNKIPATELAFAQMLAMERDVGTDRMLPRKVVGQDAPISFVG